ncbi:hypothetical protein THOM_2954 [Trachipleistophora hominis]|uniref:Uncharacterized protein n=1 Tax=Trachipleistophora hominis TaxID=72359 RepID=L7JSW1_TRAHO|nr:hypothetical protein THOM_2954 [Trachipleistophora hominis]
MDKPAPSFVYKVKQKPKVIKSSEVKPLFQFTRKRKEYEESIRCDVMDSKFFVDCEAVSNLAGTTGKGANVSNGNVVRRKEALKQKMSSRKIKDLMGDVTAKGDRKTKRSVEMRKRAAKGAGLERDDKQEEENNRNNERELQTKMLITKEKAVVASQMDRGGVARPQ